MLCRFFGDNRCKEEPESINYDSRRVQKKLLRILKHVSETLSSKVFVPEMRFDADMY